MIEIQDYLEKIKTNETLYSRHESNVVNKYKILNMEKFKNLKIARYNIFNEVNFFSEFKRLFFIKKNSALNLQTHLELHCFYSSEAIKINNQ